MPKNITISLKYLLPLLAAILAVSPLAVDMYLPAMPVIATDLSTDISMIQNSLSIYLLGYALGLILFGPMADKYSRRKLVLLGVGGFFVASVLLPYVQSVEQFLLLRFCQAFISSAATVVVPATIKEYYGKNTAKGLSYVSMIMMFAPMIAPAIGSFLLVSHSWQLIFFALAAYSLFIWILVFFFLPEANKVENKQEYSFIERYKIVFSNQEARLDIASSMVISLAFFSYITAIPFVYLEVFKVSEYTFSVLFAVNVLALMTAHFTNTRLVTRKGSRAMLWYGLTLACICATALLIVNIYQLPLAYTVVTILPLMGSISMIAVNSDALVITKFTEQSGTATAVIGTLRWSIGALAGPILAYFYDGTGLPFAGLMFGSVLIVLACQLVVRFKQKESSKQAL
ncbi:multidrug effflux MFS transporter [Litorilituus lipolyticus]|uniref:Bcr/CflA family efflux transporter n=1 Tax=Litorilituus lipolyticus TaxID=2491017 RepID=A0A502KX66_9GAMM|nr:multidrug effflux MFS transporter [Litorilituus lipolyticus]TPH16096.1 Bcr/CflA family efflux MFS transporter [Litorilituus lipolyticus]